MAVVSPRFNPQWISQLRQRFGEHFKNAPPSRLPPQIMPNTKFPINGVAMRSGGGGELPSGSGQGLGGPNLMPPVEMGPSTNPSVVGVPIPSDWNGGNAGNQPPVQILNSPGSGGGGTPYPGSDYGNAMGNWGGGANPPEGATGFGTGGGYTSTPTYWGPSNNNGLDTSGASWYDASGGYLGSGNSIANGPGGYLNAGGYLSGPGNANLNGNTPYQGSIGAVTGAGIGTPDIHRLFYNSKGGVIPGDPRTGDSVHTMTTPGEVVLNQRQQGAVRIAPGKRRMLPPEVVNQLLAAKRQ